MANLVVSLPSEEKGLIVRAVRLVHNQNLETWVRRVLLDAATLEIAQREGKPP